MYVTGSASAKTTNHIREGGMGTLETITTTQLQAGYYPSVAPTLSIHSLQVEKWGTEG